MGGRAGRFHRRTVDESSILQFSCQLRPAFQYPCARPLFFVFVGPSVPGGRIVHKRLSRRHSRRGSDRYSAGSLSHRAGAKRIESLAISRFKITIADNDLRKVMMMSRLAGVTPRFPFLNPDLAEFTGTIPAALKVRGTQLRYLFKKAMADSYRSRSSRRRSMGLVCLTVYGSATRSRFAISPLMRLAARDAGNEDTFVRTRRLALVAVSDRPPRLLRGDTLELLMLELWHVAHVDKLPHTPDSVSPRHVTNAAVHS